MSHGKGGEGVGLIKEGRREARGEREKERQRKGGRDRDNLLPLKVDQDLLTVLCGGLGTHTL